MAVFDEFHRAWSGAEPVYSDGLNRLHLRDITTGVEYAVDFQEFRMDSMRFPGWIWYLQTTPVQDLAA